MRGLLTKFALKTMFFVEGSFVKARPSDVESMVRDGHQLGLHTWDHPVLTKASDDAIREQFSRTDELVKSITGKSMAPNWRPPYGSFNARVKKIAAELGFTKMWLWDVDSLDWKHLGNTAAIVNEVEKGLAAAPRKLSDVLFHDKATTVRALEVLLPRLRNEGYELVDFP